MPDKNKRYYVFIDEIRVHPLSFAKVLERHQVNNDAEVLEILLNVLASGIGSLTNPSRLSNTFASERQIRIAPDTISSTITLILAFGMHG